MISQSKRCLLFRRVSASTTTAPISVLWPLTAALRFARPSFADIAEDLHILDVPVDISAGDLKKKYRELVRKHHPDAGGDEKTMSKITVAYDRLSSLTNREKEEYKAQRNAYRGGSGSFGRAGGAAAGGMYSQAHRTYAGRQQRPAYDYGVGGAPPGGSSAHGWGQEGGDFTRDYARGNARATYNYNRSNSQSYSENPFRNHDTVNLNQVFKHFLRMPMNSLLVRGLLVYILFSTVFALLYRRYRDWKHEEGWKASESLARHEQLERLHQLRQELQERVDRSRDGSNRNRKDDFEKSRELRVQEYAAKRQLDAQAQEAELSSWPRFDDSHGSLVKRPYDPPGITYFEPGAANERKRQISLSYGESRRERMKREAEQYAEAEAAKLGAAAPMASQGPVILKANADGTMQQVQPPVYGGGGGGGGQGGRPFSPPPESGTSGVRAYVSSRDVTPQEQNTLESVITTILRGPAAAPQR